MPDNMNTNLFDMGSSKYMNSINQLNNLQAPQLEATGLDKLGLNFGEGINPGSFWRDGNGQLKLDNLATIGNLGTGLAKTILGFKHLNAIKQNNQFNQDLTKEQLLTNAKLTQERLDTVNKSRAHNDAINGTSFARATPVNVLSDIKQFNTNHS